MAAKKDSSIQKLEERLSRPEVQTAIIGKKKGTENILQKLGKAREVDLLKKKRIFNI